MDGPARYASAMRMRRVLARIALGASAALVAAGLAAVMDLLPWSADDELVAALVTLTVASWLAFAASFLLARPAWRAAAFGFMGWLGVGAVAVLASIWEIGGWLAPLAGLLLAVELLPLVVGGAALTNAPSWRTVGRLLLVSAAIAQFVLWCQIIAIELAGRSPDSVDRLFSVPSTLVLGCTLVSITFIRRPSAGRWHRAADLAGRGLAVAAMLLTFWLNLDDQAVFRGFPPVMTLIGLAWASAIFLCGLRAIVVIPVRGWVRALRVAAAASLAVAAGGILLELPRFAGDLGGTLVGLGAIGLIASLAGIGAMHIVRRSSIAVAGETDQVAVAATCPRCRCDVRLTPGSSACPTCGLRFRIEVEAPRCIGCGQWLHVLSADACPECGRSVREPASAGAVPSAASA